MFFDIKVHLPAGSSQNHAQISNFETYLPNFAHILGDLADSINFNHISLRGSNDRIFAKVCPIPILMTRAIYLTSS